MSNKDEIKKLIKDYVFEKRGVSFVEIDNLLKRNNIDCHGSKFIAFNAEYNLIMWACMSEDYMNAILELDENEIVISATQYIVYIVDGKRLDMPLAMRGNYKYKVPHWVPCELNPKI